jgi:hypothetical protein
MTMKRIKPAIFAALVCTSVSLAVPHVSAQTTGAPSPIDQFSSFVGDGTCSGNVIAVGKRPGHATSARLHGEKILGGNWVVIQYDEEQTAANPKPYHVVQYFGYDPSKKQYVAVNFDSSSSGYTTGTSAGWEGDTITFDETSAMSGMNFHDSFTRSSPKSVTHTGTMPDKAKKRVKTDEETCHMTS